MLVLQCWQWCGVPVMIKTNPTELIFYVEAEIYESPGTYLSEI